MLYISSIVLLWFLFVWRSCTVTRVAAEAEDVVISQIYSCHREPGFIACAQWSLQLCWCSIKISTLVSTTELATEIRLGEQDILLDFFFLRLS